MRRLTVWMAMGIVGMLVTAAHGAVVLQNADWATETFRTNGMGAAHYKLPANVTNFTIEAWVNPSYNYPSGVYNYIFSVMQDGGNTSRNMFACLARGMLTLYFGGSWYPVYGTASAAELSVPLNEWTHVAVSKTKESARLFVNGAFKWEATGTSLTNTLSISYLAAIGCERTGHNNATALSATINRVFQGKLTDVRLWTVARTDEEIAANYATRLTGAETNLFLYVPFSDGTAGGSVAKNWAEGLDLVVPPTQQLVEDASLDAKIAPPDGQAPASAPALHSSRISKASIRTDVKLTTRTYTLETWAMIDRAHTGSTERSYLMGQYVGGDKTTWVSLCIEGTTMTPRFFIGSSSPIISDTNIEVGKWFHLAGTRDADGNVKLYLNGRQVGSGTRSVGAPPDDVMELFNTGSVPNNNTSMHGCLREARVWNRARTAEEIASGYMRAASGREEGLLGCWPLDEDGGDVFNKVTGAQGVMTRSTEGMFNTGFTWLPAYTLHSERAGKGIATDVKITSSDFTMETWARFPAIDAASINYLMGQYVGGNRTTWVSLMFSGNSRQPSVRVGSSGDGIIVTSNTGVTLGEWFHLAATRSGTDVTLYLNGTVVGTGTALTTDPPPDANFQLFNTGNNTAFGGDLREVRVWSYARTQAEIVAAMPKAATGKETGLVGCWPLTDSRSGAKVLNRVTRGVHNFGTGNSWVAESKVPDLAPMEEVAAAELAPVLDGAWFSVARTSEKIDVQDFTFETWARVTAWMDADHWTPLFNQWRNGSSAPECFAMGFSETDHFGVYFSGADGDGNAGGWQVVDAPTLLGRWAHYAATREGSTLKLYVNGELKKTVENYTTLSPWSETDQITLTLGGTDDRYAAENGRSLCGSMREARVWNRARSGDEIRETMRQRLYGSEPGLVGYWPLSAPDAEDASVLSNVVRNGASGYLLAGWKLVEPLELADPPKGITIIVR